MKRLVFLAVSAVAVLVVTSVAMAAGSTTTSQTPSPIPAQAAAFTVQAKVLQVGQGWVQVEILKVEKGAGLKANSKLRIRETAKTKFLRAGKAASLKDLKTGETVEIVGSIVRSGKTLTYQAASFTIME